ncbi:hypothetical protein TCAL_12355 [Tigriopus californicus]|uniref:CHCH domain-containing protein n=1 Tax=Tigriopus californicus TaxID=6832 RepID=A0A553P0H4_TIGCA|nr:MICOS complex subunit mic25-like [Tigriopus californicus]TRY71180.1 hypothetical protein TCAL_12355 [Tigriopus californicus]|eukprot:TCALIF_12355-PA protein Name:"Similar to chchd6 Coiled-coil-helix-coiled-coil-helix domain-containing protein 6, mitochondrial (Xenopus tropicalis)" AED:0.02 eAED:0.02 QI:27/1/1/1/0.66/0.75/4/158/213
MGQGQSNPRKITVINDEAPGVIKISDSVVQRIKDEVAGQKDQPGPAPAPTGNEAPTSNSEPAPPPEPANSPSPPAAAQYHPPPPQYPNGSSPTSAGPYVQYVSEPSLSALKVRAEKEEELRQVEEYWQSRLQETRNHQLKATAINEESLHNTIAAVEKLFLKGRQAPICQEPKHAVLQCYKQNPKQSLNCAQEVKSFAQCIESARLNSLNRNG